MGTANANDGAWGQHTNVVVILLFFLLIYKKKDKKKKEEGSEDAAPLHHLPAGDMSGWQALPCLYLLVPHLRLPSPHLHSSILI